VVNRRIDIGENKDGVITGHRRRYKSPTKSHSGESGNDKRDNTYDFMWIAYRLSGVTGQKRQIWLDLLCLVFSTKDDDILVVVEKRRS